MWFAAGLILGLLVAAGVAWLFWNHLAKIKAELARAQTIISKPTG